MSFSANPLSLSVPEPAFESWLRDSGYLEILDERTTNLHRQPPPSTTATTTTSAPNNLRQNTASTTTTSAPTPIAAAAATTATTTASLVLSYLRTLLSFFTINPFSKLTTDDFAVEPPPWTVGFIGSYDSYSFPSSPSQARLRVHENIKRYARNYATLSLLFFACTLYQMPVALFGLLACLAFWELVKWCSQRWDLMQYPSLRQSLIRIAQCASAVVLYCSGVQMALFCAMAVSYGVMVLHASLRKLSPLRQTTRADGNKWFQKIKPRS